MTYAMKATLSGAQAAVLAVLAYAISAFTASPISLGSVAGIVYVAVGLGVAFGAATEGLALWRGGFSAAMGLADGRVWVPAVFAVLAVLFQHGSQRVLGLAYAALFGFGYFMVLVGFGVVRGFDNGDR